MARVAVSGRVAVASRVAPSITANYILDNRNLAGANWADISTTRLTGQADPFGGTQAVKVQELAALSSHSIYHIGSLISAAQPGNWFTGSVAWKAAERGFAGILMDLGSGSASALWNLTTGARTNLTQAGTIHQPTLTIADAAEDLGGGWWRCSIGIYLLMRPPSGFYVQSILSSDGTLYGYLGTVGSGAYAFAPGGAFANRPGPFTDTTAAIIAQQIRNQARGRIVVP